MPLPPSVTTSRNVLAPATLTSTLCVADEPVINHHDNSPRKPPVGGGGGPHSIRARAQSPWSALTPLPPSVTTSRNVLAPATLTSTSCVADVPVINPLSNTFVASA